MFLLEDMAVAALMTTMVVIAVLVLIYLLATMVRDWRATRRMRSAPRRAARARRMSLRT
jgi:hypothetical protein